MTNDTINLALSIEEINLILESLGELPFRRVFQLIGRIQSAARAQLDSDGEDAVVGNGHRACAIEDSAIEDSAIESAEEVPA